MQIHVVKNSQVGSLSNLYPIKFESDLDHGLNAKIIKIFPFYLSFHTLTEV